MILCSKQEFDKAMLYRENPGDFLNYVAMGVHRELVNKLIDNLLDHQLHVVKLGEPRTENDPARRMVMYRQELSDNILVPCERCKYNPHKPHNYYDDDPIYTYAWCDVFVQDLNGEGYCPYGKEQ